MVMRGKKDTENFASRIYFLDLHMLVASKFVQLSHLCGREPRIETELQ
jgi:hypothetical protein